MSDKTSVHLYRPDYDNNLKFALREEERVTSLSSPDLTVHMKSVKMVGKGVELLFGLYTRLLPPHGAFELQYRLNSANDGFEFVIVKWGIRSCISSGKHFSAYSTRFTNTTELFGYLSETIESMCKYHQVLSDLYGVCYLDVKSLKKHDRKRFGLSIPHIWKDNFFVELVDDIAVIWSDTVDGYICRTPERLKSIVTALVAEMDLK